MEDFDVFTDEIDYTKPLYMNILNKFVKDVPATPSGPNYQSAQKLMAEECLIANNELECAFHFSESVSATLRLMAIYRDDQVKINDNKHKIPIFIEPVKKLVDLNPITKDQEKLFDFLSDDADSIQHMLNSCSLDDERPFYLRYLRFTSENNTDNFVKILKELPKEWTIVQVTAPYNPNENIKPLSEYRTEINSLHVTVLSNDYLDDSGLGPITVNVPANVTKEGEKPLFTELYSLLEENYNTIDNAQILNNKKLVKNYWSRREEVDLRMKSVINLMDKEWLGGFCSLLTGKLIDKSWKDKIVKLVDDTIADWGFIKLTTKQRVLLYNLLETCILLSSYQIKCSMIKILTEYGDAEELRKVINERPNCKRCSKNYKMPSEICLSCHAKAFKGIHQFTLFDGMKAFSIPVRSVREDDEWAPLRKAKRQPVVLIVDEMLDVFPWENLPALKHHPVSRIENIHFLYYLYKIHEKNIKDGYFAAKADIGRYVINPEKNLDRMERRMTSFMEYWCNHWSGHIGKPPPPDDFVEYLTQADLFLYCGHGDGCRFAHGGTTGAGVEGAAGTQAVTILSGCGSVRLLHPPGRAGPGAAHHHLHIAGCPVVVGMLWEVTDLEVDKVVSTLISLYVPSKASVPWQAVGKSKWSQGEIDTNVEPKSDFSPEPDLLMAITRSRGSTCYVMIACSVVARGLPVRIMS